MPVSKGLRNSVVRYGELLWVRTIVDPASGLIFGSMTIVESLPLPQNVPHVIETS